MSKLLIDANLSWRLVRLLNAEFPDITHISETALPESVSDVIIWDYARQHGFSIVTNDDDFYLLAMAKNFPPKIILLKMGNQSTQYVASILVKHKEEITAFLNDQTLGVLEIF